MQMKAFADKFESTLAASLPSLSLHHADVPLGLLGANDKQALAHQRAVRTAMKRDQHDLRSSVEKPATLNDLEAIIAALENLQVSESVATCITIPLPACMHYHGRRKKTRAHSQRGAKTAFRTLGRQTSASIRAQAGHPETRCSFGHISF